MAIDAVVRSLPVSEGGQLRPSESFSKVLQGPGGVQQAPPCDAKVAAPAPSVEAAAAAQAPSAVADVRATVQSVVDAQRQLDRVLELAQSGKTFTPAELLSLQARVYRSSQELDLAGKLVEKTTGAVKQVLNTPL